MRMMRRKIERVDAGIGSERRQKGRKIKEVVEASWVTRVTCHREPVEQDYSNSLSSLLHCTVEEDLPPVLQPPTTTSRAQHYYRSSPTARGKAIVPQLLGQS